MQHHCLNHRGRPHVYEKYKMILPHAYEYVCGDDGTRVYDAFSCYDVSLPYYT
jgi:hypothetical protein